MAKKNPLEGKEVLQHGDGYATIYPSYSAVFDGYYINNFQGLLEKLEKPVQLNITSAELKKLKDSDPYNALLLKFKGGCYECGPAVLVKDLKTGDIKPSHATGTPKPKQYNIIVLDADGPKGGVLDDGFDDKVKDVLGDYEYYAHATVSSTNEAKRRRIIIPLASPVTADVREATIRFLAQEFGITNVDKASKNPRQLMCLPCVTTDGEKYAYHNSGKLMNATEWLPAGWEDVSTWPKWPDETKIKCSKTSGNSKKRVDVEQGEWIPCWDKNRLHNAYNKTYRISDVLKESGRYVQESETRWSHTYDSAKGGIQVTNDSWLWSHYGNDILSTNTPLDAYETAIVLKYGSLDKENWKRMLIETSKDDNVKKTLMSESEIEIPADAESWEAMYDMSSEEGIARICADYYPHQIRGGAWWRYDNGIYSKVKDEVMVQDALRMVRTCSLICPDNETLQSMVGRVNTGRNITYLWKGIKAAQEIPDEMWENKPNLMHFTDYTIDMLALVKGEEYKIPHNPEYLLTQTTGYNWDEVENVDTNALNEIITNIETYLPDESVRRYCQMSLGRALVGGLACNEDKAVWFLSAGIGKKSGANGKSTILRAVAQALGGSISDKSYFLSLESKMLYYSRREESSEGPSPNRNKMRNKRLVNFREYDYTKTLDDSKYKNFSAGGTADGRGMCENGGNFDLKCVCVVDANGQPGIRGKDNGMLRRTRFIPFEAELTEDSTIRTRWTYDHKIGVAMMYWMVLGLKMWVENGMRLDSGILTDTTIPEPIKAETMTWFESFSDPFTWFDDNYIITHDTNDFIVFEDCYKEYSEQMFIRGVTDYAFKQMEGRWLREHGITTKVRKTMTDGKRLWCYVGVYLVTRSRTVYGGKRISVVNDKPEVPSDEIVKKDAKTSIPNIFTNSDFKAV